MEDERPQEAPDGEARRVYPPHEVQARLQVSASGLRRLAGIYERAMGDLPRDERGRVWPEKAIEILEEAREAVQSQRAVSIEAALRGQKSPETSPAGTSAGGEPHTTGERGLQGRPDVGAAILGELRALRMLVEEQNRRIAELEEVVRGGPGRELEAGGGPATVAEAGEDDVTGEPGEAHGDPHAATMVPEAAVGETDLIGASGASGDAQAGISRGSEDESTVVERPEERNISRSPRFARRVLSWFGFGESEGRGPGAGRRP